MQDEYYSITPKALIALHMGSIERAEALWSELIKFAKRQAPQGSNADGVPCLILEDGGYCAMAKKQ